MKKSHLVKKIFPLLILSAFIGLPLSTAQAQSPQALFQQANQDYQKGDYLQAAIKYDSLVRIGYRSAALYNNLGSSY